MDQDERNRLLKRAKDFDELERNLNELEGLLEPSVLAEMREGYRAGRAEALAKLWNDAAHHAQKP